jgi:hypothetical protein
MEAAERIIREIENTEFTANQRCIERLDNHLQDLIKLLSAIGQKASSEWLGLKDCTWTLHERYHMDSEEELKWTFHHIKHRVLKNAEIILNRCKAQNAA